METIRIKLTSMEMHEDDHKPVGADMFYDPHYRHWVIYPVDAEGNQLAEARYGFGKAEAKAIRADIEESIKNGTINRNELYY